MKKIVIASLVALAATSASAWDFGVNASRDYAGSNRSGTGLTVGHNVGIARVAGSFDRTTQGANDQDKYSIASTVDLTSIGSVKLVAGVGASYLDNKASADGYALNALGGVSIPLTKSTSLSVIANRSFGQDRVKEFNGTTVNTTISYKF